MEQQQKKKQKQFKNDDVPENERTAFVSGLPFTFTEEQIETFFENSESIQYFLDSGRCRGFAHIVFKTQQDLEIALAKNGEYIENRKIDVVQAKGEKEHTPMNKSQGKPPDDCQTIFIKNLPYNITEDELGDELIKLGCTDIINIRFSYHPFQKHFKGFGYVDFKFPSAVKRALKMDGKMIKGRKIQVDFEVGKAKGGYKQKLKEDGNNKYNKTTIHEIEQTKKKKVKVQEKKESILNMSRKQLKKSKQNDEN